MDLQMVAELSFAITVEVKRTVCVAGGVVLQLAIPLC